MQDWVEVPLSKGKVALIDTQDMLIVGRFLWSAISAGSGLWYACRSFRVRGKCGSESMHRRIMEPPPGMQVDHINHNPLDNRRANLRVCTASQNSANRKSRDAKPNNPYVGIRFVSYGKKWQARIKVNGVERYLGSFSDPQDAARAYDAAAREAFGELTILNFPLRAATEAT